MTRAQLLDRGLSRGTIESWLHSGRLRPVWTGVYAVGHIPTQPRARAYGATLAAGAGAALARWSAAAFYGAVKRWPEPFELFAPRQCRVSGLAVRRSTTLLVRDVWHFDGLSVTSPARTALDLAALTDLERCKSIVDHLRLRHGLDLSQLRDVLGRNPRHPGARALGSLIGQAGPRASRSALERRWPGLARAQGLPAYETNLRVAGYEVDVLVDGLVIVEIDTFFTHLLNFRSDRRRDADILARTGIPTIRITDDQFDSEPELIAGQIRAVVAARRAATAQPRRS